MIAVQAATMTGTQEEHAARADVGDLFASTPHSQNILHTGDRSSMLHTGPHQPPEDSTYKSSSAEALAAAAVAAEATDTSGSWRFTKILVVRPSGCRHLDWEHACLAPVSSCNY